MKHLGWQKKFLQMSILCSMLDLVRLMVRRGWREASAALGVRTTPASVGVMCAPYRGRDVCVGQPKAPVAPTPGDLVRDTAATPPSTSRSPPSSALLRVWDSVAAICAQGRPLVAAYAGETHSDLHAQLHALLQTMQDTMQDTWSKVQTLMRVDPPSRSSERTNHRASWASPRVHKTSTAGPAASSAATRTPLPPRSHGPANPLRVANIPSTNKVLWQSNHDTMASTALKKMRQARDRVAQDASATDGAHHGSDDVHTVPPSAEAMDDTTAASVEQPSDTTVPPADRAAHTVPVQVVYDPAGRIACTPGFELTDAQYALLAQHMFRRVRDGTAPTRIDAPAGWNEGVVFAKLLGAIVSHASLHTLADGCMVNDDVVNFHVASLHQQHRTKLAELVQDDFAFHSRKRRRKGAKYHPRLDKTGVHGLRNAYIFNSYFYEMLSVNGRGYDYNEAVKFTRPAKRNIHFPRLDISDGSVELVLIPVHLRAQYHWTLLVVDLHHKSLHWYDSLLTGAHARSLAKQAMDTVVLWLVDEMKAKGKECLATDWKQHVYLSGVPHRAYNGRCLSSLRSI